MKAFVLLLWISQAGAVTEEHTFDVRHDHAFGACRGRLILGESSVRYETENPDHAREWSYPDVESFEIVSAGEIRIHTYESAGVLRLGSDRDFTFELDEEGLDAGIYRFLQSRSPRPVRSRVVFDAGTPETTESVAAGRVLQELPVRHDHLLGGCQGTLTITEDRIVYSTETSGHSRIWRLADLESFASTGDFDLRISTSKDTFHFDLKVPLDRETYSHIWERVYEPQIQTYRGQTR